MNRKLTLILALIILVAVSISIATAVNDTQDELTADDSSDDTIAVEDTGNVQSSRDTGKLGDGGLTIEKVWNDSNDKAGKGLHQSSLQSLSTARKPKPVR